MYFLNLFSKIKNRIAIYKAKLPILRNIILISFISGIIYYFYLLLFFDIKPNSIAKFNIVLFKDYEGVIDEKQYLEKIQDVYKIKEYDIDNNIAEKVIYDVNNFFDFQIELLKKVKSNQKVKILENNQNVGDLKLLKEINVEDIELIRRIVLEMLEIEYKKGITLSEIPFILSKIEEQLDIYLKEAKNSKYLQKYKEAVILNLAKLILPNKFVNITKTLEKHIEMINKIPRIYSLKKGSVIVKKGQNISDEAFKIINETKTKDYYRQKFLLSSIFVSIFFFLFLSFIYSIKIKVSNIEIYYLSFLLFFSLIFIVLIDKPFFYLIPFWTTFFFAFFVGGFVLYSIVFICSLILYNIAYYQIFGNILSYDLLLFFVITFLFFFYFVYKNENNRLGILLNRLDIGFMLWVIIFFIVEFSFMFLLKLIDNFVVYFSFSIVSVMFSFILTYFFVLLAGVGIEGIGINRMRWLLDLNNPLLSEFSKAAPGTFNHSLRVSELSESCALAIGANPILVKIGALYHDIGKMLRPKYFVENLVEGEKNPHDEKEPFLSASIIKAHVSEGVKIAQRYNLPPIISEFIKTHHGTTTILYFFVKAKKLQNTAKKYSFDVREEDFKYPGPKPYTKEMVILMICDSVEAASRTLSEYSFSSIEKLTENIISRLQQEGQFSDVDLTFKELSIIKDTLIKNLYISYHTRINYPKYAKKTAYS